MTDIAFVRSDLEREVKALERIAAPFLDARTRWRLTMAFDQLKNAPRNHSLTWEIPLDDPLVTEPSIDEYEPGGRKGSHMVIGSIAFCWHLKLEADIARISDNASTKIGLWDGMHDEGDAKRNLGTWHMDIG